MTDPFDLLRDSRPPRGGSPPPIDELWARLDRATDDEPQPSAAVTRRRADHVRWRTSVVTAACVAVALAVTAGAIIAFSAGRTSHPGQAAARPTLASILGVLRRPPNGAPRDLGVTPLFGRSLEHRGTLVRAGARVATTIHGEGKLIFVPLQPRGGGPAQLLLSGAGGGDCCITTSTIEHGGASETWGDTSSDHGLVIVPDGVSRVSIDVGRVLTAPVHGNVVLFSLPAPIESLWSYPMTWYGASGAVIRRFRVHAKIPTQLRHYRRYPARIYPPASRYPNWGQPGGCANPAGVATPAGPRVDVRAWSTVLITLDDELRNTADRAYWPRLAQDRRAHLTRRNVLATRPAARSPFAPLISKNCGKALVQRSISVVIGPPHSLTRRPALDTEYWVIERHGQWLLWWGQN